MTVVYRFVTNDMRSRFDQSLWIPNMVRTAPGGSETKGQVLCTDAVLHAYQTRFHAGLFNFCHGGYHPNDRQLWEGEATVVADDGSKLGCTRLTLKRRVDEIDLTLANKVELLLRLVKKITHPGPQFARWADDWARGKDRTYEKVVQVREYTRYSTHFDVRLTPFLMDCIADVLAITMHVSAYENRANDDDAQFQAAMEAVKMPMDLIFHIPTDNLERFCVRMEHLICRVLFRFLAHDHNATRYAIVDLNARYPVTEWREPSNNGDVG